MYISSHAINIYFPIVQNIRFWFQWWQPKDPKTHGVFVALCRPHYGFPKQGTSPALSLGGTMCQGWFMGCETRVETRGKPTPKLTERAWRMVLGKTMKNHPLSFGESESWHLKCYFWVTMLTLPFFGPCGSCGTTISQRLLLWKIKEYNLSHTQRILL